LTFAAPLFLSNTETYDVRILAEGSNATGNNTGLDAIAINSSAPIVTDQLSLNYSASLDPTPGDPVWEDLQGNASVLSWKFVHKRS
jgi:hypothetical protein